MNIQDIPDRIGYREFLCQECGVTYILLGRDRFSPSGDECPSCGDTNHPKAHWGLSGIVDRVNSLVVNGIIPITVND